MSDKDLLIYMIRMETGQPSNEMRSHKAYCFKTYPVRDVRAWIREAYEAPKR